VQLLPLCDYAATPFQFLVVELQLGSAAAVMKPKAIISRGESLQILMNDLRKAALERRAAELGEASPEKREAILTEIDREVRREIRRRRWKFPMWAEIP
jgi:hypothetical protein